MTTPSLQCEAERLGIMPRVEADFSWMLGTCYEPPMPQRIAHRRARFWRLFAAAALLVVISCALAGFALKG